MKNHAVPAHVHQLVILLTIALHKHTILFSKSNQKKIEQWVESAVRLYLHDRTEAQRTATMRWLRKHRATVWKSIEAVFSFESIIHEESERTRRDEVAVTEAWRSFYTDVGMMDGVEDADSSE